MNTKCALQLAKNANGNRFKTVTKSNSRSGSHRQTEIISIKFATNQSNSKALPFFLMYVCLFALPAQHIRCTFLKRHFKFFLVNIVVRISLFVCSNSEIRRAIVVAFRKISKHTHRTRCKRWRNPIYDHDIHVSRKRIGN